MDKARLEALSDSIFAVAMTLLIFDVSIPLSTAPVSNAHLWFLLGNLWPLFVSYIFTFIVLSVFWINHHFLFHTFTARVNRNLNLLNILYLMFLVFIPFSARLFGAYPDNQPTVIIYGLNILAVALLTAAMQWYVRTHPKLRSEHLSKLLVRQAQIRIGLTISFYIAGVAVSFFYIPASILLFLFPIIFNIIPGSLTLTSKLLGYKMPKDAPYADREADAEEENSESNVSSGL
jgi:uncharacterized membrane protein